MLILGVDLETTGLDLETARILELGYAVYDTETKHIYECHNELLYSEDYPACDPEAEAIHGITPEILKRHAQGEVAALCRFVQLMHGAQYLCAHNGPNFDIPILKNSFKRRGIPHPDVPCIDTRMDIDYPKDVTQRRLKYLASDHGFHNPFPHRALFDVVTMLRVLSNYDIDEVIKNATSPSIKVRAVVNYDDREKAKERRYSWDSGKKIWTKEIKEFRLAEEQQAPFQVVVLKEENGEKSE